MRFFKKRGNSRSRRKSKVWRLWCQRCVLGIGILTAIGFAGFFGYHNDFLKKTEARIIDEVLTRTADAGFKVKDILVIGRAQVPAEELLANLSIRENMPIFGINITKARESLVVLPWVKDVSISRRLPNTIIVELKERVPIALWQYRKKISMIDQDGVLLTFNDLNVWKHLPMIVGKNAPKHVNELLSFLNAEPKIASVMTSAVLRGGRRWDLYLKNSISVKLPEQDEGLALRHLSLLVENGDILGRNIERIDLRQPEKVVVMPVVANEGMSDRKNKKTSI
ncbi:MAG: FtsQ-type POTRA domain-containing protein [Alphaproteobacteria bacterium]|nr:FtsQ-type POTRA domain-containing protein [Alphaproteobacteria bacterium]